MFNNGYVRVAGVVPEVAIGCPSKNIEVVKDILKDVKADMVVFPEMTTTGYSCEDLFYRADLLDASDKVLAEFMETNDFPGVVILGAPLEIEQVLYNVAIAIQGNKVLGIVPKMFLPHTGQFYETRWFQDGFAVQKEIEFLGQTVPVGHMVFKSKNYTFGIEVCADMWSPLNPSTYLFLKGAEIVVNISSSPEDIGKFKMRRKITDSMTYRHKGVYMYVSSGVHESTSHQVFGGDMFVSELGECISTVEGYSFEREILYTDIDISYIDYVRRTNGWYKLSNQRNHVDCFEVPFDSKDEEFKLLRDYDLTPFVPKKHFDVTFNEVTNIQTTALIRRLQHLNTKKTIIGVSGGLDSTFTILQAHKAYTRHGWDPKEIVAISMPSYPTSDRTRNNAKELCEILGVTFKEVPIHDLVDSQLALLDHDEQDVTYENIQARARTNFLFNLANKEKGIVLGTGDMTEMALGWCTYAGDQYAHYGLNAGVPKTLVRWMVAEYARRVPELTEVLTDIVDTPISPELIPGQVTEDTIGSYEINDFIMYRYLKYGDSKERIISFIPEHKEIVESFFRRFYASQFKRSTMPEGPKVIFTSLSSHADLRLVSDLKR